MKKLAQISSYIFSSVFLFGFLLGYFGVGNFHPDQRPSGEMLSIDGEEIRFVEKGSGQDILLIHGTPGSLEDMQPLFDSLSLDNHVIAFDRPGHGYSSAYNIPRNISHNAKLATALIDHFDLDSVIVIGHSYGGCISMKMAVDGNRKVKQFVVLGSPLFNFNCEHIYKLFKVPILSTSLSFLVSGWYAKSKIGKELPSSFGPNLHLATNEFIVWRKDLWSQPKVILSKSLETANIEEDFINLVPRYDSLKNEVIVLIGDDDVPYYKSDLLEHLPISGLEAQFLPNTGHFVQIERLDLVLRLIDEIKKS